MDTEKAKIFLTVINEGSLSGASEELGYTTSGISRSIASLEEETGLVLLKRSRTGVELTSEAEALIPVMKELVYQADKYKETADRLKGLEEGTVTIGISYAGYFRIISDRLKAFTDKYPKIKIKTLEATSTELLHAIETHDADFAIVTYRESDLNFRTLKKDYMVACLPTDHPLAKEKFFPLEKYENETFIAPFPNVETDYSRALKENNIHPNIQYTTTDVYATYCMIEAGLGVSLLNRLEAKAWKGRVKILPTKPEVSFKIGIMYPDINNMTIAAKTLLNSI